ncbi:TP0733 family outer membrane beta-barrel protein [Parasphaerochaeta coccoides]|uniref:Outer membrane protein beta-barrel domain-containing protein n=1 Tax=Parasphaerochaeta coccoides (strain ATCC BAA-1237 / DSM 17374 / SPN1) TaxID=760011 RepID=F4GJ70_PARC1|nr:hypothetical protein [Parasphaerochaeta coccoides]AEC01710.1 hypothetical protein Spico_0482 [Parasphaerochaeta coccoides DSM 17374]
MTKKCLFLMLAVLMVATSSLVAADSQESSYTRYDKGSQMFTFRAGPTIPAFMWFFNPKAGDNSFPVGPGGEENKGTGLSIGGYGGIAYQAFISPVAAFGGELGYSFGFDRGGKLLTIIPIAAKLTWIPLQGIIETPLSVSAGLSYLSLGGTEPKGKFSFFAALEVGVTWFPSDNWGVGLTSGLWLIPDIYLLTDKPEHNSLLGIVPIALSVTYRN